MSKPRKKYQPKVIKVPVTGGLVASFRQTLRDCEIAMRIAPNDKSFDGFAQIFNVIGLAAHRAVPTDPDLRLLQSGALSLQQMAQSHERTGKWIIGPLDLQSLVIAGQAAQRLLTRLDVATLYLAYREVSA
jgi:hypothetical protein